MAWPLTVTPEMANKAKSQRDRGKGSRMMDRRFRDPQVQVPMNTAVFALGYMGVAVLATCLLTM